MNAYKSFGHALSHAMDICSEEICDLAEDDAKDLFPKFSAIYCAREWANHYDCLIDDGEISEAQANADWRELYLGACDYFGFDAMADFPCSIQAALALQ
jgi:hypothetical protein